MRTHAATKLLCATLLALSGVATNAGIIVYSAQLTGAAEAPPNASAGTGFANVTIDDLANTMRVQVVFAGLEAGVTASHIHCCTAVPLTGTAGVATVTPTFTGFPLGVTSGTYDFVYNLTLAGTYNSAFVTASGGTIPLAMARLLANMATGQTYFNIHTSRFPGGEIRGFLVPEPATLSLLALGLLGAGFARRRRVG